MKMTHGARKALFSVLFFLAAMVPAGAGAQGVSGRTFTTFIYSEMVDEASTSISFETNGTLLIDMYDGFGLYLSFGSGFAGAFSAPKYNDRDDLLLFLTGIVVADFYGGTGIAFRDADFYDVFYFFGYAE